MHKVYRREEGSFVNRDGIPSVVIVECNADEFYVENREKVVVSYSCDVEETIYAIYTYADINGPSRWKFKHIKTTAPIPPIPTKSSTNIYDVNY